MCKKAIFSILVTLSIFSFSCLCYCAPSKRIVVASKNFTEQYILAEIIAQLIESQTDLHVERKLNLGGTQFAFEALRKGDIDIYPEYTGTGLVSILKQKPISNPKKTFHIVYNAFQKKYNLVWLNSFGFNNTYALAVRRNDAQFQDVTSISDLKEVAKTIKIGATHEFLYRQDGFPNLTKTYGIEFPEANAMSLDPGLMYTAIKEKQVDMIAAFSTDGRLEAFKLRLLKDDRQYFPPYEAAPLVRQSIIDTYPEIQPVLKKLQGTISNEEMMRMNYEVDSMGKSSAEVAHAFLSRKKLIKDDTSVITSTVSARDNFFAFFWSKRDYLLRLTQEHLLLTLISIFLAILFSIPTGILLTRFEKISTPVFNVANIIQTIPSLALIGFLIPILGIGVKSAIVALFLYALLPLIRNTYTGIRNVDPALIESCKGMGMTSFQILWKAEIPLALPFIIAGIRTGTVIIVGTATLAALIGAGGYGDPIFRGISAVNSNMILLGAIPAALLSIVLDQGLHYLENRMVSKGLRL